MIIQSGHGYKWEYWNESHSFLSPYLLSPTHGLASQTKIYEGWGGVHIDWNRQAQLQMKVLSVFENLLTY